MTNNPAVVLTVANLMKKLGELPQDVSVLLMIKEQGDRSKPSVQLIKLDGKPFVQIAM